MTNDQLEQIRVALEAKLQRAVKRGVHCAFTGEVDIMEYNDGLATAYGIALSLLNVPDGEGE